MYKRFRKQKKKYDCGIIALINALIFLEKDFDYKTQYAFFKKLLLTDSTGTLPTNFDKVIFGLFTKVRKISNPKQSLLRKNLARKKLIVFATDYQGFNHIGLIIKLTSKYATLVNWGRKHPTERKITIDDLKMIMSEWSCCWIVEEV